MYDSTTAHSTGTTQTFQGSYDIQCEMLMVRALDFNPIENLWFIIKREIYTKGRQFKSKDVLRVTIKATAEAVKPDTIKKLIESITNGGF